MTVGALKIKLLLYRILIAALPLAAAAIIRPYYPSVAAVLFVVGLLATLLFVIPALSIVGMSVTVPGKMVSRGAADKGPPSFQAKEVSALVRFCADDEVVERLPTDGRWRLRLFLRIENISTEAVELYDIRFHVYCKDTGPPMASIGATDQVEVTDANSMMGDGHTYPIAARSARTFELSPTVTREPASAQFVIIFGAFAYCVIGDKSSRITARIPCDSVFCFQAGHLAKMSRDNISLYKRKHEASLSGSILIALCEKALTTQLAAEPPLAIQAMSLTLDKHSQQLSEPS
jgi:hypothetical protein